MFTQWLAVYLKKWDFEVLLDVYENHPGTKLDSFMLIYYYRNLLRHK